MPPTEPYKEFQDTPAPTPVLPDPALAPTEDNKLPQIRTYQGDIANAINKQNESLVSIQRAEQSKKEAYRTLGPEAEATGGKKVLLLSLGIIILLGLGGAGVWYSYTQYKIKTALPTIEILPNKFISTDTTLNLDASILPRQNLLDLMDQEEAKSRTGTEQIVLRRGPEQMAALITTEEFLSRLNATAPKSLVRAFDPLYMLGVEGDPSHTFLLIKLDSFENAFAGMLAWETTLIPDMIRLFQTDALASATPSDSTFEDITIQNKDARIVKDPTGHTVLLYSFYDNNMLIMTDNEATFRDLLTRLDREKLSR